MSLWDPNGSLTIPGDPNSPYVGLDSIRAFLLTTGSFSHPPFLSCRPSRFRSTFTAMKPFFMKSAMTYRTSNCLAGLLHRIRSWRATLRKIKGKWLFSNMFGGSSDPLSVDHYYFP